MQKIWKVKIIALSIVFLAFAWMQVANASICLGAYDATKAAPKTRLKKLIRDSTCPGEGHSASEAIQTESHWWIFKKGLEII